MLWLFAMRQNSSKAWNANGKCNGSERVLAVTLKLRVTLPAFQSSNEVIQQIISRTGKYAEIAEIKVDEAGKALSGADRCQVCCWIHDDAFTQMKGCQGEVILLGGVLPDIVAAVHRAHEKGLAALSTKDRELQKICGSYKHPCKAFDDLNHRDAYKYLFNRRRGFISLRGLSSMESELKSESKPE